MAATATITQPEMLPLQDADATTLHWLILECLTDILFEPENNS